MVDQVSVHFVTEKASSERRAIVRPKKKRGKFRRDAAVETELEALSAVASVIPDKQAIYLYAQLGQDEAFEETVLETIRRYFEVIEIHKDGRLVEIGGKQRVTITFVFEPDDSGIYRHAVFQTESGEKFSPQSREIFFSQFSMFGYPAFPLLAISEELRESDPPGIPPAEGAAGKAFKIGVIDAAHEVFTVVRVENMSFKKWRRWNYHWE